MQKFLETFQKLRYMQTIHQGVMHMDGDSHRSASPRLHDLSKCDARGGVFGWEVSRM